MSGLLGQFPLKEDRYHSPGVGRRRARQLVWQRAEPLSKQLRGCIRSSFLEGDVRSRGRSYASLLLAAN